MKQDLETFVREAQREYIGSKKQGSQQEKSSFEESETDEPNQESEVQMPPSSSKIDTELEKDSPETESEVDSEYVESEGDQED